MKKNIKTVRALVIQDVNSAFSPDQSVLNFCSTAKRSPTPPHSLARYTNRPFGHERIHTKRLVISTTQPRDMPSSRRRRSFHLGEPHTMPEINSAFIADWWYLAIEVSNDDDDNNNKRPQ